MNVFLDELVKLQQDGSGAISAPTNWKHPPLLDVATDLDRVIDDILESSLRGMHARTTGRWHFFVGSPGNGKSAAVGKLWRKLHEKGNIRSLVRRRNGDLVDFVDLGDEEIPYLVEVYEDGNKFSSLWIAQDASVVQDPYIPDVNPASDLLDLLKTAWEKGVSLIVCTNRGVVERAFRDGKERFKAGTPEWFKPVAIVDRNEVSSIPFLSDRVSKKVVFEKLAFDYTSLDVRSLALCNDTFVKLVEKASSTCNWECCTACTSKELCPFLLNRNWLAEQGGASILATLVAYAELHSGQVVVFREANALISFLLSGCARDYPGESPCSWVADKSSTKDFFALLSRRFYIALFSSYAPYSLEPVLYSRKTQLAELDNIKKLAVGSEHGEALSLVIKKGGAGLSTDVGLPRLLGAGGDFSYMDPLLVPRDGSFYDEWDSDLGTIRENGNPAVSTLERKCIDIWVELEKRLESIPTCVEMLKALRRWVSSFTIRLGAMTNGDVNLGKELAKLVEVITLSSKEGGDWSEEELIKFSELQAHLKNLVFSGERGIRLKDNVSLSGNWADTKLVPEIRRHTGLSNLGLQVKIGNQVVVVSGQLFSWLVRKRDDRLSTCSFPPELLETVIDAQSMAACKGDYAYQDSGVTLKVTLPGGKGVRMERIVNGEVTVYAE